MNKLKSKSILFPSLFLGLAVWLAACTTTESPAIIRVTPIVVSTAAPAAEPISIAPETAYPIGEGQQGYPAVENDSASNNAISIQPTHSVPTPIYNEVPAGEALAIAYAQDLEITFQLAQPKDFGDEPVKIRFNEFLVDYDPGSNEVPELSPLLKALDGKTVQLEGYMAPPLKLGLDWFQLTAVPVGSCAFCSGASQWTSGIALVYVEGADEGAEMLYSVLPLRIVGELHVGENVDVETGMVSLVRIYTNEDGMEEITFSN